MLLDTCLITFAYTSTVLGEKNKVTQANIATGNKVNLKKSTSKKDSNAKSKTDKQVKENVDAQKAKADTSVKDNSNAKNPEEVQAVQTQQELEYSPVSNDETADMSNHIESASATPTASAATSVDVQIVNRRGTTGNPLYHDGLPSASEVTDIALASQAGNVITFNYYFKDLLSIPSYGRQAVGIQSGQLIITINVDNTATIQITGGVPEVTNTGSDPVGIANYTIGETRTVPISSGLQVQGLLVQQSFGQSPLGSVDNLAGDYLLTFL